MKYEIFIYDGERERMKWCQGSESASFSRFYSRDADGTGGLMMHQPCLVSGNEMGSDKFPHD